MISVSKAFKAQMREHRDFEYEAVLTFGDGSTATIGHDLLCTEGCSIRQSADSNALPLGYCIGKVLTLQFYNEDDAFSEYNFIGCDIKVYLKYVDGELPILLGEFKVIDPETYGSVITITAYDEMYKVDKSFDYTAYNYPMTLSYFMTFACGDCGLEFAHEDFPNSDMEVTAEHMSELKSYREVIGACAMLAGGNAVIRNGYLTFVPYVLDYIGRGNSLDGGVFDADNPYSTGDEADGGSFKPWDKGYELDDGTFEGIENFVILKESINLTVSTDDVEITGLTTEDSEGNSFQIGTDGYVIKLENNLFSGREEECLRKIFPYLVGLRFRIFTADHTSYPILEFLDPCVVMDRNRNEYASFVTDIDMNFTGYTTIKCSGDSPVRNSSKEYYRGADPRVDVIKKDITKVVDEYQSVYTAAVERLGKLIANSLGAYETQETQDDGSIIYYFHDRASLSDSRTIWRYTIDGFTVSTDGGKTYNAGMDAQGNLVANILSAAGVNAEWINAGTITGSVLSGGAVRGGTVTGAEIIAGGSSVNGKIKIVNASDNLTALFDNTGQTFYSNGISRYYGTTSYPTNDGRATKNTSAELTNGSLFFKVDGVTAGSIRPRLTTSGIGGMCLCSESLDYGIMFTRKKTDGTSKPSLYLHNETDEADAFWRFSDTLEMNSGNDILSSYSKKNIKATGTVGDSFASAIKGGYSRTGMLVAVYLNFTSQWTYSTVVTPVLSGFPKPIDANAVKFTVKGTGDGVVTFHNDGSLYYGKGTFNAGDIVYGYYQCAPDD